MKIKSFQSFISDMQCADCENAIEDAVSVLPGIQSVGASFSTSKVEIKFDSDIITSETICAAIGKAGYHCQVKPRRKNVSFFKRLFFILLGFSGIALLLQLETLVDIDLSVNNLQQNFSYGLLFLIGVLTSFHCIGMCGSFVMGYSTALAQSHLPAYLKHLLYGIGKILSYTFFGALFGWFGQFVVFTLGMRSLAAGLAGGFLIFYGLSMLDACSGLRRFRIVLPKFWTRSLIQQERKLSSPFMIGLMNGLMIACGPLQAMYVLAAGTGSPWLGAKLLAVFALGTLPVMFVFGYLTSLITSNSSRRLLQISAFIIIGLGTVMLNRSLILAGNGFDFYTLSHRLTQYVRAIKLTDSSDRIRLQQGYQVIYMEVDANAYQPDKFVLQKNIPVKWIINVKDLTPCNNAIVIPALNRTIGLQAGLQLVEFKPQQAGDIHWSCSMGMMQGLFRVQN